jgi:hypothetical protein
MGAESEIITHDVTVADATVSKFGFGIPLVAAYHNFWPELVRSFNDADEMTVSPFNVPTDHELYIAVRTAKAQNPSPPEVKVGKLTGAITHSVELTPVAATAGLVYSLLVDGQAVTATADGTPTLAEITALLTTAISALPNVTATDGGTKVTANGDVAGRMHSYESLVNLTLKEVTAVPSPSPATDLAAIRNYDGDWYLLHLVTGGALSAENVAPWVETQQAIFIAQTADAGAIDGASTTDLASVLATAKYTRSGVLFHEKPVSQQPVAGWGGLMLPKLPGPATWANKEIAGVDTSTLSASARSALKNKKANYYVDIKGLGFTLNGWASSGRFFDVTVAIDWFDVGVSDRVILLLHNNDVVPYTNKGIETVRAQVLGQIEEGIGLGIIDGEQEYFVTAPQVANVAPNDKAGRLLPNIAYSYVLSGAIHSVKIKGVVKV